MQKVDVDGAVIKEKYGFDKPYGNKSAGPWRRQASNWRPMFQSNTRYWLHEDRDEEFVFQG